MTATTFPIPPSGVLVINPFTGAMDTQWQNYFLQLTNAIISISGVLAPVDAQYWVSHANAILTGERNLGALATGYVKITVGGATAVPSSDNTISANVYTPTLTNVANIAASTAFTSQWLRIGSTVTVSGKATIDPTAGATLTQLGISLPVASVFAAQEQCAGVGATAAVSGYSGSILADTVNHRAELDFTTVADVASRDWYYQFAYTVI